MGTSPLPWNSSEACAEVEFAARTGSEGEASLSEPFWPNEDLGFTVSENGEPLVGFEHKCCDLT